MRLLGEKMNRILFTIALIIFLAPLAFSETRLSSFQAQLIKSSKVINGELEKIRREQNKLNSEEKWMLSHTYIGDESMTEEQILSLGEDMITSGVEKYEFYLNHLKTPIRKGVGNYYR